MFLYKKKISFLLLFLAVNLTNGQSIDEIMKKESLDTSSDIISTFNGTRLLNGHSIETRKKGVLEFLIQHRFGRLNSGFDDLFGLDDSTIRFGFEYAFTDDLTVALGRSSYEKTFDMYAKYKLFKQREGKNHFPVSVTLFGATTLKTLKITNQNLSFNQKLAYTSQILVAKKFNDKFSLQLMPTYVHYNWVPNSDYKNDIISLGIGTRYRISKKVSINAEYYPADYGNIKTLKNSLALGVDIETGGHIFQLILSNSRSMIEKGFIAENTGNFFNGDIHLGFNISRAFQISK